MIIRPEINGAIVEIEIEPGDVLLDMLRRSGYTGVKEGCREGECGACVVLLDGKPINSCLMLAVRADGRKLTTIEGIGNIHKPHRLQEIFVEEGAVQCGYCTPGILLSVKALLDSTPSPTDDQIREAIDGHLCRCTGYTKIFAAIKRAIREITE